MTDFDPPRDERYAWSSPAYAFMMQGLEREILRLLGRNGLFPLSGRDILEVGCGSGYWLREWVKWGADADRLVGADLSRRSLTRARRGAPGAVNLVAADAGTLPFRSERFDIVFQSTVFTSILEPESRASAAGELLRVVRPEGAIIWYDFLVNNPANSAVRGVAIAELRRLFAPHRPALRRVTLAPPLARWLVPRSMPLALLLASMPFLRTHCLAIVRKR